MDVATKDHRAAQAIAAIVISVFALSLGDAIIKATSLSLPLWQIYVLRSAFALPLLWWLVRRNGPAKAHAAGWVILRSALLVVMWLCYYLALPLMPLSLAAAAYYTGPLFIVALSTIFARRWPPQRTMLAILAGFVGVVLVIRPDTSAFQIATMLPILAALLYACAMVLTSRKCQAEDPYFLALVLNCAFIVTGLLLGLFAGHQGSFILGPWRAIDTTTLLTVAVLAIVLLIGNVGAAFAYQNGPPTVIAVFDYCYLAFSLLWGAVFFGEFPGAVPLLGIGMIMGAGFLALRRPSR